MSHTPPVPDGARSPYPIRAAQAAGRDEARQDLARKAAANLQAGADAAGGSPWPRFAAGAAIGSAAIVAGLLFYNRSKSS